MNPNSRLWLCKTKLENDYKNTLTFSTKNAQRNYFIGDPSDPSSYGTSTKMYSDYTYLRIENAIKVDDFIENIDTNNYAVILNNNKYYYYFITSMDYIDDSTTKIHIELDVMQTYFFDITYNNTFVEREHVVDDTAGKHTIPEGLETGEYIGSNGTTLPVDTYAKSNIVIQVVYDSDIFGSINNVYNGVFSGTLFMIADVENALKIIKIYDTAGQKDYIVSIFMYYGNIEGTAHQISVGGITADYNLVTTSAWAKMEDSVLPISKPTAVGNYTPRNKKLLTYPYCYLLANNLAGTTKSYRYEYFDPIGNDDIVFTRMSAITVGGSIIYTPKNYKLTSGWSSAYNYNECFIGGKYPVCSWVNDSYTNWLTQSSVNRSETYNQDVQQAIVGAGLGALGLATGSVPLMMFGGGALAKGIGEGINDTLASMNQKEEHQLAPMELNGLTNAGDVVYGINYANPVFYPMHITEEYASIIDKFFDQYGYQVNTLKTPAIHTRRYWNYLKTKNCNFTGNIPQEYMGKIKNIFNSGITFWHDPSKMFDYSQTNSVLS